MPLSDIIKDQQARQAEGPEPAPAGSTNTAPDADSLLMGGAKSMTFGKIGSDKLKGVWMGGEILDDPESRQTTKYQTGEPLYWDNAARTSSTQRFDSDGNERRAMWQLVVTLATSLHDDDDDDGERRLFIDGAKKAAVKKAVKEAGAKGLRRGGNLMIAWVDDAPSKVSGFQDKKLYEARYTPPPAPEVELGDSPEDEGAA